MNLHESYDPFFGSYANDPEDVRLDKFAVPLAYYLMTEPIPPGTKIHFPDGGFIPYSTPGYKGIADEVRKGYCK